jgi:hypothetical protein
MIPKEIFLSHSSEDHPFTASVAETIRRHGIPVWHAPTNLIGAQEWQAEIGLALKRCDWFVVVLSPNAVVSMWVRRELQYALRQPRFEKRIVPILHRPCDPELLSWVLPAFEFVDFTPSFDEGCSALLRVWGIGYQKLP